MGANVLRPLPPRTCCVTVTTSDGRAQLLAEYGRFYGEEHLAVTFTAGLAGEHAKRVVSKGWDKTQPLSDGDYGEAYVSGRGLTKNPAVVLRPSNLIVLECDTEGDLVRIQGLSLPSTVTVRSSAEYKRHFWFRPPHELEALPYVAFRFESGRVTADSGRYFLCPPAIHPSGRMYSFLTERGPGEADIAELPEDTYRDLSQIARQEDSEVREEIAIDPEAKIKAGKRREMIFRYACMLRRWGLSEPEILVAAHAFNVARCHPPVEHHLVAVQVDGAMKKRGDQEIEAALMDEQPFELVVVSAQSLCDEPDIDTGQLLGPLVLTGGRTIVVGDTGEGKTTLSLQLVRAILRGEMFLDWEGAGEGRALVIDLEQGRRSVKRALREAQLDGDADVDLVLVPDGLSLDRDDEHVAELERVIGEGGYSIVVLDPYYKAHRADEPNAERPIVDLMRLLDALRTTYGFSLILPAHPRKEAPGASGVRKLTIHDVAGSGAVTRGAEVVLGIERVSSGRARIRFLKDREGDLPVSEAWHLLFEAGEGFRRDPKDMEPDRDYQQEMRAALEDGSWRTVKELKLLTKAGDTSIHGALKVLTEEGVTEYQKGPKGRRRDAKCWRLKGASEGSEAHEALRDFHGMDQLTAFVPPPPLGGIKRQVDIPAMKKCLQDPEAPLDDDDGIPF